MGEEGEASGLRALLSGEARAKLEALIVSSKGDVALGKGEGRGVVSLHDAASLGAGLSAARGDSVKEAQRALDDVANPGTREWIIQKWRRERMEGVRAARKCPSRPVKIRMVVVVLTPRRSS